MDSSAASDEEHLSPTAQRPVRPTRRSRVSLACQRCKKRKQKCNGNQPSCARCTELKLECHYVMPINQKPSQAKIYIKALEDRVAELETLITKQGNATVSHDHWDGNLESSDSTGQSDLQPLLNAVRDLSLDVAGSYVGGASTITLGRALESALAGKTQLILPSTGNDRSRNNVARASIVSDMSSLPGVDTLPLGQIDANVADKMVTAYLGHLYVNFPVMYSYTVLELHKRRHELKDVYEQSILHLIYGLGGHFLEKTSDSIHSYHPETHYEIAWENREEILRLGDTRSLTYLLLLSQHSLRMPKDPGPWTFVGLAMKMCVELGLHRQKRSSRISFKSELNKRLFWSAYFSEREIAIAMGRPPSISDHDIDVDLPLDVDEANQDIDVLRKAAEADRSKPAFPQTTLTCYIHLIRLRKIESGIQHTIYRVDKLALSSSIYKTTDMFLDKLAAWRDAIPQQSTEWDPENRLNFRGDEYSGYDSYMASYHKSIRVLLQPRLYEKHINQRYLELCAEACRGVCETYKRLHYRIPLVFTSVSLQTVFLAGLTLVYCMWHDSTNSNAFKSIGALTDCSIILYVMTEKWPAGKKYRDLFESVKSSVLDAISEGKHVPRTAVATMNSGTKTILYSLQESPTADNMYDDLNTMICDMTGQPDFWENFELNTMEMEMELGTTLNHELMNNDLETTYSDPVDMSTLVLPEDTKWDSLESYGAD